MNRPNTSLQSEDQGCLPLRWETGNSSWKIKCFATRFGSLQKICTVIWGDATFLICSTELDSLTLYPVVLPLCQILQFYVRISVYKIFLRLVCVNGKHPGGSCSQSNSHNDYTTEVSINAKRKHCNNTAFRADMEVLPDISILPLYTADCKIFLCTFFACIFDDAWKVNGKNTILDICYINQIKLHKQLTLHWQAKV